MFRRKDYSTAGQIVKPTSRVVSFSQEEEEKIEMSDTRKVMTEMSVLRKENLLLAMAT
jgi:hypothetical protein